MAERATRRRAGGLRTMLAGGILALLALPSHAQEPALEFAIKATYLYKFAPFITWPTAPVARGSFDVCLAGNDEVTKAAPEIAAGQEINGKPILVRRLAENDSADGCQILYVANGPSAAALLDSVRRKPILTVTDAAMPDHGIIGFTMIDRHVRFDIDMSLAVGAGLTISSKLLNLANAVTPVMGAAR